MEEVSSENYFYVCNGEVLKDLQDLLSFLRKSEDEHFYYHFNGERNDFANWVRDVLQEKTLANKLEKAAIREDLIEAVSNRLKRKPNNSRSKKAIIGQIKNAIVNG